MKIFAACVAVAVVALSGCQHPALAPAPASAMAPGMLHSPWDTTPVALTSVPYECGPMVPVGPDVTVMGLGDGNRHLSQDVKAAVYGESSTALVELTSRVVKSADMYRATGSSAAAQCTIHLLASAAYGRAMTGYIASSDAWKEVNRSVRASGIAYLKVRNAGAASPEETTLILQWLGGLVRMERAHYEHAPCGKKACDIKGHGGLETAMGAAAVGIAANDNGLFRWAVGQYRSAVGEIDERGMLHYDNRGRYALKFNLESAAALVQIAELGEANGVALYGYDNGAIHRLVHTVALGIVSPDTYQSVTKAVQVAPKTVEAWQIAWAAVYNRRFPDPVVGSLLRQIGPVGVDMWGGEPWDPDGEPDPQSAG